MFQRVAEFHRAFGQSVADAPALPEQSVRDLRIELLKEELHEFCEAFDLDNRVEMADALADICYIIAGTMICYGLSPTFETFESPYDEFLPNQHAAKQHNMPDLLNDFFSDYEVAERSNTMMMIDLTLMNLLTGVFGVAWRLNIPLNAVFAEVHKSNMSKIMPDGSILRRPDGKILKSDSWSPPDIARVLAERELA